MNINDRIWEKMKETAIEWAASDRPLPSAEECIEQVGTIAKAVLSEHSSLRDEARMFYAGELLAMIRMRRERIAAD